MSDDAIFFRFKDKGGSVDDLPVVGIRKEALAAVPDSLLATLAEKRWQPESTKASDDPIEVNIVQSPCKGEWDRKIAEWIPAIYEYYANGEEKLTGIPDHIELEDAFSVLHYFGLAPDDITSIDLGESSKIIQIRAKLWLRNLDEMESAKDFILEDLLEDPYREQFYIFVNSTHNYDYIKENNYKGPIPVVKLGGDDDECDKYFELIKDPRMRKRFLDALKEEGLNARFLHRLEFSNVLKEDIVGDYTFESTTTYGECFECGKYGHYQRDCPAEDPRFIIKYSSLPKDKCWVNIKRQEGSLRHQTMYVIRISVPVAGE